MSKFSKLVLRNFQVHKKLEVVLDPFITTIVGASDVGKSAIIRALRFLCLNRPSGTTYIRHGANKLSVRLNLGSGESIVRHKSSNEGIRYTLDGETYRAMGAGALPERIAELLNVDETNFQRQFDPPFWFLETAGQVSKNLNQIVNLDVIDKVLSVAASKLRKAKAESEILQEQLKAARARRDELHWAVAFRADYEELASLETKHQQLKGKADKLTVLLQRVKVVGAQRNSRLAAAESAESVLTLREAWQQKKVKRKRLTALVEETHDTKNAAEAKVPDLEKLIKIREKADKASAIAMKLSQIVHQLKEAKEQQCLAEESLNSTLQILAESTQGKCPICGSDAILSQFCAPTSTSVTEPPLPEKRQRTGMKYKPGI